MKQEDNGVSLEEVAFINPLIWKTTKLSRIDFLHAIKRVYAIQIAESPLNRGAPEFSYFPQTLDSWSLLERLHSIVNDGDFSVFDERGDDRVFGVMLPKQVATWLLNTKVVTIQRQILNWLAGWSVFHGKFPGDPLEELPAAIRLEVESIKKTHYGSRFTYEELWENAYPERSRELLLHYENITKEITGAAPPEILKIRECDLDGVDLRAWGLSPGSYGRWPGFTFHYRYAYFRYDYWKLILENGDPVKLVQAGSDSELWQKLLHTFEMYPTRRSHIFSTLGEEVRMGYVYLFRGEESGHHKIGFHTGANPYGRQGSLQTGSAERLIPIGNFRVASQKTESIIKRFFESKRVRPNGEWFALTEEDVANLLDEDWRIRNNLF